MVTVGGFIKGILRGVRCTKSLRVLFLHRRPPSRTTLVLYSRAERWNRVSVSAHSAGAYTATLLVRVNVVKGGGRVPPTLTSQGRFYPHHWMYARKQRLQLCVLCEYTHKATSPTITGGGTTWTGDFKCREVKTGFYRNRSMPTGSSGTLIGWKSGQTTYFPLLGGTEWRDRGY